MDIEAFQERAAIIEYDGGIDRFTAETMAAEAQGMKRWEAINAIRQRDTKRTRDNGQKAIRQSADNLSGVQPHAPQENRSVPVGHISAGWGGSVLPSLRMDRGGILR